MFANLVPTTISNPKPLAAAARNKSILDCSVADIKELKSHLVYNGASLDSVENHIGISHSGGRDKCVTRDRLYMNIMVYLMNKLKQAKDPSGSSILDNTILVNGYAVSDGNHSNGDGGVPIIIGGGRNLINPGNSFDVAG